MWILLIIAYLVSLIVGLKNFLNRFFLYLGENIMPGLSNILLVPVIMVLLQVFEC